jgi:transaldolase
MAVPQNPLQMLASLGQSVWLDFIERGFVRSGRLAALIRQDGVSGVTSNPAIFHKAIGEHTIYREAVDAMARQGLAAHEIHEALIIEDIRDAADALRDVFQRTQGRDGFVSLEVSPKFARDTAGTYWEAERLWALVSRPNLMIKVPGTHVGRRCRLAAHVRSACFGRARARRMSPIATSSTSNPWFAQTR